jgi:hypothetical protein
MPQPPHVETPFTSSEKVRDIVIGMSDGLTAPFASAAGLINASKTTPLNLSTIYSAPNHPDGTVHTTKAEVEAEEAAEHH